MLQDVIDALRRRSPDVLEMARAQVEQTPQDPEAHHALGLALRQAGDDESARASFDRATEMAPDNATYHFSLAGLSLAGGDLAQARKHLIATLALDPNHLAAYITLAHMALARNDLDDAERQLKMAERVNPEHPHVLLTHGQLHGARGDHDTAIKQFSAAAAIAPEDTLVLSTLADAYMQRGNLAFAEQAYRRALEGDPHQFVLRRGLAEALRRQSRLEDGGEIIEQLQRDRPNDIGVMQLAGELAVVNGHIDQALDLFRAVIALDPHHFPAIDGAMRLWVKYQGHAQAREFLDNLLQQNPDSVAAWDARYSLEAGNSADMFAQLQRWQAAMPEHPLPAERLALAQDARGDVAHAETLADIALGKNPYSVAASLVKARAELHRDPELAIARLRPFGGYPDPSLRRSVLGWLGHAFDRGGQFDQAVHAWQLAQALNPQAADAMPAAGLPTATLESMARNASPAIDAVDPAAPVFLYGPPGSGVDRLAAIFREQTERPFLSDRFGAEPRADGFGDPAALPASADAFVEGGQRLIGQWRDRLAETGAADIAVIDWLRIWDARLGMTLRQNLPGARLIVALRDPRDLLLNWLAFGSPARLPFASPTAAAVHLQKALEQLAFTIEHDDLQVLRIDPISLQNDPLQVTEDIARFIGLSVTPSPLPAQQRELASGNHPTLFTDGHWRDYREVLAGPFAVLAPIAERLGFAVD